MSDLNVEALAATKFDAWTEDALDDLPNNDEITAWALDLGIYLRMCTVIMLNDDESLSAKVKTWKDCNNNLELLESITAKLEGLNGFSDVLTGAVGRLAIASARFEITR